MKEEELPTRITGRHVLLAMIGFFGLIIAVNVAFVFLAVGSFPGEKVEKSYYQGLNYNDTLAERARQADIGWRLLLVSTPTAEAPPLIEVKLLSREGGPVFGANLTGKIVRPANDIGLQSLEFTALPGGLYRSTPPVPLGGGAWDLEVVARERDGEQPALTATARIVIQ